MKSRRVYPDQERVVKFWPDSPPRRGDIVLVSGERCRVTRCRIKWLDSGRWHIRSLYVKPAPE